MSLTSLRIAHTYDIGTFAVMKALLSGEGINVLDVAMGGHLAIAGADLGYYIEVIEQDKQRACDTLRDNGLKEYILERYA